MPLQRLAKLGSLLAIAAPAGAQVSPHGPELQVNSVTQGFQRVPSVAASAAGDFVVVWQSQFSGGSDTSNTSIQGRRFDANGVPLGAQFQVNTYTTFGQRYASVAVGGQGDFVVVWASYGMAGPDVYYTIRAQRFDADGTPRGGEFQVNSSAPDNQWRPVVGADDQGDFVVAWQSVGSTGTDSSSWSVQARRFAADGTPAGAEFQVNTYTPEYQVFPRIAVRGDGSFVVVWTSYGSHGTDSSYTSTQARFFDAGGVPLGDELQVNELTTHVQTWTGVALDGEGNAVVVWKSEHAEASIEARRLDSAGVPLGGQFQVNTYSTFMPAYPAVAADPAGSFVVAWSGGGSFGTDNSLYSVQLQRFDRTGAPLGGEFQVNTYTTDFQWLPTVAADGDGDFVVVWESDGSYGTDTSGSSIQAQRFDGLFRDGFESGDTDRWTAGSIQRSR